LALHPDTGFVYSPGVAGGFELGSAFLLQEGSIMLNPPVDGGMVYGEVSLNDYFFNIPVAR
jgi:hypothetical protein